jgi:hypothetical protein
MQETTASSAVPASTSVGLKCPTRIITYGWGERYVDVLLSFTLPAVLAPGNLPYVASQVPCELVILTQRRYFSKFNGHPTVARIREFCPVRLVRLDDLIVSQDKYGMTLTYALHRAFSDLGPAMIEHWQIFLNADFILADGSLRTVIGYLARGQRIVASPSYCTVAEEVIPELRKYLNPATSTLSISHRELARLILQHRHTVIRGKTVNQTAFHMRYTDQFYWSIDDSTLLGYQMPVSIVGLRPQRYVPEPNSYWDFGLIWEYCPDAEVCVIGDSDEFTMLELRDRSVAEDQVVAGPPDKKAIAELMVTWVTPYQQHFLKFPLTLHDGELPPSTGDARLQLRTFVDEVMSNAPALQSHIKHSQWEYHYPGFHHARQMSSRIRRWFRTKVERAISPAVWMLRRCRAIVGFLWRKMMEWAKDLCRPVVRVLLDDYLRPALRRFSLEIVKSDTLIDLGKKAFVLLPSRDAEIAQLKQEQTADRSSIADLTAKVTDLGNIATEYQLKLERSYDYQAIMAQDQLRVGMSNLEPEFLALYDQCRQYTMTSWERLYAFYKSVQYVIQNKIPGDLVECGVWRGGGMKLAAQALLALGATDRRLFLYDTFEGMTEPDPTVDVDSSGNKAVNDWTEIQRRGVKWSSASIEEVREVIAGSGYPMDKVVLVKGPVENTIPGTVPDRISLLRLDTDWYSSTKHEIEHLYPRLSVHGVLILDDYGHYRGARRAVDEYFDRAGKRPFLNRVDYSCRVAIKSQ